MLLTRSSETPRPLVVSRSRVQEVKGGGEDQLGFLDAGQVELQHVFAVQDSFEREKTRSNSPVDFFQTLSVFSHNTVEFPVCH